MCVTLCTCVCVSVHRRVSVWVSLCTCVSVVCVYTGTRVKVCVCALGTTGVLGRGRTRERVTRVTPTVDPVLEGPPGRVTEAPGPSVPSTQKQPQVSLVPVRGGPVLPRPSWDQTGTQRHRSGRAPDRDEGRSESGVDPVVRDGVMGDCGTPDLVSAGPGTADSCSDPGGEGRGLRGGPEEKETFDPSRGLNQGPRHHVSWCPTHRLCCVYPGVSGPPPWGLVPQGGPPWTSTVEEGRRSTPAGRLTRTQG